MSHITNVLEFLDYIIWSYIGLLIMISSGIYFTIKSNFYQFRVLFNARKHIKEVLSLAKTKDDGIHPLKLYFTSVGGMVGLGNIVAVATTITIGGPGSLIWLWIASMCGTLIKYSEIYLGIKYRVKTGRGSYDGGPMYFLKEAFKSRALPIISCVLLCIYGAEIYQFTVLADVIAGSFMVNKTLVVVLLIIIVFFTALGGVKRVANICTTLMPFFMMSYVLVGLYIICLNYQVIPSILKSVLTSAFTGHGAVGGFAGSTLLYAMHYGVSRAVYSGDIGIGYDSIVNSETRLRNPETQSKIAIFSLFSDTMICTISIMIILVTGVWKQDVSKVSDYMIMALSNYIPNAELFLSLLVFIAAFTTIVGYLAVGIKCAKYLSPRFGKIVYILYSITVFFIFSSYDQNTALLVMSVSGGMLMMLNISGVLKLRNVIEFK
ncbi:putative amino acid carrier protein [Candidatus Cyrtobacter comes]|uniref:Amino acid carrier protein n=1 Tax=Candidatus Cyrtobacter comes TaxID=675776 RepID=A0ABU5L7E9_9RICK|nr:amino acid carrier protein [Candidatus Cyrtobacter comes]MDZ5762053.1 putative amino acid carrier protein [Candidatus Cyrtobacter comes]